MNPYFENLPVDVNELPQVSQLDYLSLDPNSKSVAYISNVIFYAIMFIAVNIAVFAGGGGFSWWVWTLYGLWLVWFGVGLLLVQKNYELTGYVIRHKDIIFKTGVIFRHVITIPFNRIQHVEITEGPVQKLFSLASLKVYTAGGSGSDLVISGLYKLEAGRVKEYITGKIQDSDEEE